MSLRTTLAERRGRLIALMAIAGLLIVTAVIVAWYLLSRGGPEEPTGPTLTVGVVGDHDDTDESAAVFQQMGRDRVDFIQSLGDLSYDETPDEAFDWCDFVKQNVNDGANDVSGSDYGDSVPLQIVEGNHDDQLWPYVSERCFPDRVGAVTADEESYGREYFFDVPRESPTARFIITPDVEKDAYRPGTDAYVWLSEAIDSARRSGIAWVIVAQHKNYISTGSKDDEVGSDFFNLLLSKKVDLILEGHDHTYQRSHQLALGDGCRKLSTGDADDDCIVDDGASEPYQAGRGTVLVINGSGGRELDNVDDSDDEADYFAKIEGRNTGGSYGYLKLTITPDDIEGTYVVADGDDASDSFRISKTPER